MERKMFQIGKPDVIVIGTESDIITSAFENGAVYGEDISVDIESKENREKVRIRAEKTPLKFVQMNWKISVPADAAVYGDAWERGYGDLEWKNAKDTAHMPWYFLVKNDKGVTAYGVMVRPSEMCYWKICEEEVSLYMDVRCGGEGVLLEGRVLEAADIVCQQMEGCTAFEAAREFCRRMCQDPIFPSFPVYGSNNWYYAYGDSSEEEILTDTDYVLKLTEGVKNKPYMVIDDCWQEHHRLDEYNGGPWREGNKKFPDMKGLADKLVEKGVRPGIWIRLLLNEDENIPKEWRLSHNGCLDPSHPDALKYIQEDVKRICDWGYTLIKHDFSTFDIFGKWGFEMQPLPTPDGWHFYDRSKTSAEVVKMLYQAILDASAPETLILGCNTIGHLGAGLMHMNRTGDDTSGMEWERTRKMGVNTLAFRLPQHGVFYDVDADCVGIMGKIDWKFNGQWADVLAESGTSLFVSAKPGVMTEKEEEELHQIMLTASEQKHHRIPADWEEKIFPEQWEENGDVRTYHWY